MNRIVLLISLSILVNGFFSQQKALLIKKAITKFSQSKTAIIIAHRLSTIKNADRIIFLKNGSIIEDGTHKSLMSKRGLYAD